MYYMNSNISKCSKDVTKFCRSPVSKQHCYCYDIGEMVLTQLQHNPGVVMPKILYNMPALTIKFSDVLRAIRHLSHDYT